MYKRQVCFIALYFLATLLVNLLNHVLRFPVLRRIDWLLGGVLGLGRGLVAVSYTHLDVYKRQRRSRRKGVAAQSYSAWPRR